MDLTSYNIPDKIYIKRCVGQQETSHIFNTPNNKDLNGDSACISCMHNGKLRHKSTYDDWCGNNKKTTETIIPNTPREGFRLFGTWGGGGSNDYAANIIILDPLGFTVYVRFEDAVILMHHAGYNPEKGFMSKLSYAIRDNKLVLVPITDDEYNAHIKKQDEAVTIKKCVPGYYYTWADKGGYYLGQIRILKFDESKTDYKKPVSEWYPITHAIQNVHLFQTKKGEFITFITSSHKFTKQINIKSYNEDTIKNRRLEYLNEHVAYQVSEELTIGDIVRFDVNPSRVIGKPFLAQDYINDPDDIDIDIDVCSTLYLLSPDSSCIMKVSAWHTSDDIIDDAIVFHMFNVNDNQLLKYKCKYDPYGNDCEPLINIMKKFPDYTCYRVKPFEYNQIPYFITDSNNNQFYCKYYFSS